MPKTASIERPERKTHPDLSVVPAAAVNGPDRDEFLFMVGQIERVDEAVAKEKDARKKLRQHFKNRGVNLAMMDMAIAEKDREDDTTLDNMRDLKRYYEFLNLPVGFQFALFDTPQTGAAPDIMAKAFAEGREAGVMGRNTDDQKYPPMTPEGQEHFNGWTEGQAVLAGKMKVLETGMTLDEQERQAKAAKKAAKAAETAH